MFAQKYHLDQKRTKNRIYRININATGQTRRKCPSPSFIVIDIVACFDVGVVDIAALHDFEMFAANISKSCIHRQEDGNLPSS